MKTVTGKRVGQSGPELFSAFLFSSFLHILAFVGAFVLFGITATRVVVPPFYRVTLVDQLQSGLPAVPMAEAPAPQQALPPQEPKKPAKPAHRAPKAKRSPAPKNAMPDLAAKKAAPEREYVAEDEAPASAKAEGKPQAAVNVSTPGETRFNPYISIVREKIERNWNPPPGAKGTKATIQFRIIRSGRVTASSLGQPSGNFYFDQAAMRAILLSSPLPPLPEEYLKDAMEFSVDLMAGE